jgi:hypothetical protein
MRKSDASTAQTVAANQEERTVILTVVSKGTPYPNVNEANWPDEDCVKVRVRAHGIKLGAVVPASMWNVETRTFVKDIADRLNVTAEYVKLPATTIEEHNRRIEAGINLGGWKSLTQPTRIDI